jgi:hypothetical protein
MEYTQENLECGKKAVRDYIDNTGYGAYISDKICTEIAEVVLESITQRNK